MGSLFKKLSPVAMLAGSDSDGPKGPKPLPGGGIERPLAIAAKNKKLQQPSTLLEQGVNKKIGL